MVKDFLTTADWNMVAYGTRIFSINAAADTNAASDRLDFICVLVRLACGSFVNVSCFVCNIFLRLGYVTC